MRRLAVLLAALAALLGVAPARAANPPVGHVFVVLLDNKRYDETFGAGGPRALPHRLRLSARGRRWSAGVRRL